MHPEMTARQNIFLNGSILGMKRKEINLKLDEIVNFAGIEKYLDTPIKRFSSGMYVRLGFSVAAFLEPEILIVDEVLAVGDSEFQKKAIGKMKHVSSGRRRTVIFVSHNLVSVENLCTRSILIDNGKITHEGNTSEIIKQYLSINTIIDQDLLKISEEGNGKIKFKRTYLKNNESDKINLLKSLTYCELHIHMNKQLNFNHSRIDIGINNSSGHRVAWISTNCQKNKDIYTNKIVLKSITLIWFLGITI